MNGEELRQARERAGMSQRDLARLCGVASSSIARFECGAVVPSIDLVKRCLAATGVALRACRLIDPKAVIAARQLLGDSSVEGLDSGDWHWRYAILGDTAEPELLAWRASRFAMLTDRPAATGSALDLRRLPGMAQDYDEEWAWTGAVAADIYSQSPTGVRWVTAYAANPDRFRSLICDRGASGGVRVSVFGFDEASSAGVVEVDTQRVVAPLQAVVDCYGGTGRMPDQAAMLLGQVLTDADADAYASR